MSADRALAPSMIGRHAQLQECEARLRLARDGVCQVVLIAGEAGIGKSRLVREFAALAGVAGEVLVLQGRCHEEDGVVPYAPFVDALRELMRAQGQGSVAASAGPWV